jgi:hypothetical protein
MSFQEQTCGPLYVVLVCLLIEGLVEAGSR